MREVVLALVLAACVTGCFVRGIVGGGGHDKTVTGTCEGACERYVQCKGTEDVRARCNQECPDVFADRQSLMMFESLDCPYVLGFVEGDHKTPATTASAVAPAATR